MPRTPLIFRRWLPCISLWVIALLAGVVWRVELEMTTGWASLNWISRFHWAIPVGVLAFIVWVLCVSRVSRPHFLAAALFGYAVLGYFFVQRQLIFVFGRVMFPFGDEQYSAFPRVAREKLTAFLLLVLVPLTFSALCRCFGIRVRFLTVMGFAILFMLSWPMADFVHDLIENRRRDGTHALKSGYIIPLFVLSLGFPVLRARRRVAN